MKDRTPAQREAWAIRWGVGVLCVLTAALLGVMLWMVVLQGQSRQQAAERADRTIEEVHRVAERVERQAARLDAQAAEVAVLADALEGQAADLSRIAQRLEQAAVDTDVARAGFRAALTEILRALESDLDPFRSEPAAGQAEECTPPTARRCREN